MAKKKPATSRLTATLADLKQSGSSRSGVRVCAVRELAAQLPEPDANIFMELVDQRDGEAWHVTAADLARAFTDTEHRIGQQQIGRHRRGDCGCHR